MAKKSKLPEFQFPGQIITDSYGVIYAYDETIDCFVEMGEIDNIPVASFDNTGLMLAKHKGKLDNIPNKSGGFAIMVDPLKRAHSDDNPDGLIFGDIKLISDSLDITCLDVNGNDISSQCYNCIDGENPPGLNFQLSEKFLNSFCARLPVIPGARGDKGDTGDQGDPGTGDGPQGEPGQPGLSYDISGIFTGVKTLEVGGVFQEAVVDLELDKESGILTLIKSEVASGGEDTPAGKVLSDRVFRDVEFTPEFPICDEGGDVFKYKIIKGDDDLPEDVYIYRLPDKFETPGESEVSTILLSDLINSIIEDLRPDYEAAVKKYNDEIKQYILEKDEIARQQLCSLSKQLSECEWQMPLEYCIGIGPCADISGGGSGLGNVFGGRPPNAGQEEAVKDNSEYAQTNDTWSARADCINFGTFGTASSVLSKSYFTGGINNITIEINSITFQHHGTHDEYVFDIWTSKAEVLGRFSATPVPYNVQLLDQSAAGVSGKIYNFGGGSNAESFTDVTEYSPNNDTWLRKSVMPKKGQSMASAVILEKAHVFSGGSSGQSLNDFKRNDQYDAIIDSWASKTILPDAKLRSVAFAIADKGYETGGSSVGMFNQTELTATNEYDPVGDSWLVKANTLFTLLQTGFNINDKGIIVNSGESGSQTEEYDPVADSWVLKTSMISPRDFYAGTAV